MGVEARVTRKKKILTVTVLVVVVLSAIIGFRIYSNISANKERAARMAQGKIPNVTTAVVGRQNLQPVLIFSGSLEPVWNADVSAKVDGRLDRVLVEEGDQVAAGTLLAQMDTAELEAQVIQAEGNMLSKKADLEQARLDLQRMESLSEQGAVSVSSLDTARTKRDLAIGQVRSYEGSLALAKAKLDHTQVRSPKDGVITKRFLQSGGYTKLGTAIVTVADLTSLLAKVTVGEAQVSDVAVGKKVSVRIEALGNQIFEGVIVRVSPSAATASRAFMAEIEISNPTGILKPGMFAKAEVTGAAHPNALVVPESALVMREDQKTVYVVNAERRVQQRLLKTGYIGGGWAEILEGLQEGEQIVVSGQNKLRDGAKIDAGDSEAEAAK